MQEYRAGAVLIGGGEEVSLVTVATVMMKHWRALVVVPVLTMLVAVVAFLLQRQHEARATFKPDSNGQMPALANLAAQFGVGVGVRLDGEPLELYAEVLESREILTEVLSDTFTFRVSEGGPDSLRGGLLDLLNVDAATHGARLRDGTDELKRRIHVAVRPDAGVAVLTVHAPWPELAEKVARRLLDLLEEFNVRKRQSQAAAERRFVEGRVREAQLALEGAEGDLKVFLEENRTYQESPRLSFEFGRLQRRVDLRQQVYVTLAQAYEQARIDEVRDTPVITVLDAPEGSAEPAGSVALAGLLGLFAGGIGAGAWVLVLEAVAGERRRRPGEYQEFVNQLGRLAGRRGGRALEG